MGAAGPAIKIGSQLASSAGSKGGGGGGGISPQQAALAQYNAGQQELNANSTFGGRGLGMSTMSTYANAGANLGGALQAAGFNDQNLAAQNQVNQAQLQQLASNAGFNQGASQGNFGNTSGNFGNNGGGGSGIDASGGEALA